MSEGFDEIALPEPPTGGLADGPALDQADIDALFGDVGMPVQRRTGVRALIDAAALSQERLPMLEVVCDRVLRTIATSMRHLTSDTVEVNLQEVSSGRFGELMNRVALPAMFGVFRIEPWGGTGVVVVETSLIYAVVDALLGGRGGGGGTPRVEGRPFTSIETALVGRLMELVLREFATAFELVALVQMPLDRVETSPRFAAAAGPAILTASCTFRMTMEDRGGRFSLLLPSTSLEPVRDKLVQRFMGEKSSGDDAWQAHFDRELRRTILPLQAVLCERVMSLGELQQLKVGDTVPLNRSPDAPISLRHEDTVLGQAQLGQRNGTVALRMLGRLEGASS